ncbi:MAG: hypothetical protein IPQ07_02880 [Myxococcales bacterium]|nr:hypothetical protein [Myxococcales bacterium]
MSKPFIAAALFITALPFAIANADRPPPPRPPKEAFEACARLKAGDACTVTLGTHTLSGVCATGPDGTGALACKPEHPPGPPPEAVEACAKSSEGDACSVSLDDHTITGTCAKGPDGAGPLACKPDHPPQR